MFSFSQSRFGGSEPWFRLGSLDVGTAGVVALAVFVSIFVRAGEGPSAPITKWLTLAPSEIVQGQIWRIGSWWLANAISLNALIAVAIIFLLGTHIEGLIGRDRMVRYFAYLVVVPSIVAVLFHLVGLVGEGSIGLGASTISSAIFLSFVIYMPNAKGFFGIPIWVFAAVFVLLDLLQLIGSRGWVFLLFYLLTALFLPAVMMRSMGISDAVFDAVPKIPLPGLSMAGEGGRSSGYGGGSGPYGGDLYGGSRPAPPKEKKRFGRRKKKAADVSYLSVAPAGDDGFAELGIDAILDQVSEHGIDSLTADQKQRLDQYSKNRRKGQ